jgi:hypothetical protein
VGDIVRRRLAEEKQKEMDGIAQQQFEEGKKGQELGKQEEERIIREARDGRAAKFELETKNKQDSSS